MYLYSKCGQKLPRLECLNRSQFYESLLGDFYGLLHECADLMFRVNSIRVCAENSLPAWTDVKMKSLTCEFVEILWERIQCLNWSQIYETLCVDFLNSLLICPDRVLALKSYKSFNGTTSVCLLWDFAVWLLLSKCWSNVQHGLYKGFHCTALEKK